MQKSSTFAALIVNTYGKNRNFYDGCVWIDQASHQIRLRALASNKLSSLGGGE